MLERSGRALFGAVGVGVSVIGFVACSSPDETPLPEGASTGGTASALATGGTGATTSMAGTTGSGASGGAAAGTSASGGAPPTDSGAGGMAAGLAGTSTAGAGRSGGSAGMTGAGAGGLGAAGTTSSAGMTAAGGAPPGLDACPTPPADTPAPAVTALNAENTLRLAMGLDCASIALALCTSAQNHCDYYTQNKGTSCETASPHDEMAGCPGFTGSGLGDRFKAAGYMLRGGGSECMAFLDDPAGAVTTFVNSVYHRTPILDPWMRDFGYGGSDGCDTIDFGTGAMSASNLTAVYPYPDQTGVPTSFDGSREGPEPPTPPSGWPSGYPITVYAKSFTVTSHTISLDGDPTPLAHEWLAENDQTLPDYAKVLYTDAPLTANTTYHVVVSGTLNGADKTFDWTFTTGAAQGGGRPRPGGN